MNFLLSRAAVFRAVATISGLHLASTYLFNSLQSKSLMLTVSGFKDSEEVTAETKLGVTGVLKRGSIQVGRGTLEKQFVLTDFRASVKCRYTGRREF
jgi:cytochrome c-type biogenesis protein CcmE